MAAARSGGQLIEALPPFRGAVLAGGRSRRMGTDKAFLELDGAPLVLRVVTALEDAGAEEVTVVGGDMAKLSSLSLGATPDAHPGAGPLGGLLVALEIGDSEQLVVVLPCDLKHPSPAAVIAVVEALQAAPDAAFAVPVAGEQAQWLHGAWRPALAASTLRRAFDAGTRSLWEATEPLARVLVRGVPDIHLADADLPGDLD